MSETGSETKSEDGVESNENNPNETVCSAGSEENYINQDRQPDQENPQDPQENPDSIHAEEDPVIQEEPCVEEAEEKNTETEDVIIGQEDIKSGEETRNQAKEPELGSDLESYSEPEKTEELPLNSDSQEKSHTPVPDPPTMDEIATSELESLKLSGSETSPLEHRIIQNNENETVEEPKQFTPTPQAPVKKTPAKSGIRPPSAVLRNPKVPSLPRPATTTPSTPRAISTPRQTASTAPSPRPLSRMPRERSDVQKSTSTRSIDNVGKFTPKVNAKFVNVKSKVGSVTNHKAGGGNVEIFSEKRLYNAQSKVGSLKNTTHVAGGGNVQIESRKLDFSHASPKVGSKTNYQPAKSDVKILSEKLTWEAKSKVGSLDNATHKPTGGNVQILNQKLNWKAESKVGSKDNMNHRPGGGNVKIFDEKIRYVSTDSSRNHSALDISSL